MRASENAALASFDAGASRLVVTESPSFSAKNGEARHQ